MMDNGHLPELTERLKHLEVCAACQANVLVHMGYSDTLLRLTMKSSWYNGKQLGQALASVGLKDEDVLITNPVFFWPREPDDRPPTQDEVAHGRTHLDWMVEHAKPRLIVTLGAVSTKMFVDNP